LLLWAVRAIEFDAKIGDDAAMKSTFPSILFAATFGAFAALPVIATGNDTGRDIAANCASCHHGDRRKGATIPDLAGMDKATIIDRVREFRDGRRPSTIMRQLASGYTDAQIEAAASYLAAQKR
jgi:cytochrome subunit of sulfide dehydrogenase